MAICTTANPQFYDYDIGTKTEEFRMEYSN